MRKSASEIIRGLEQRIARLEKQAGIEEEIVLITRRGKALYIASKDTQARDTRRFFTRYSGWADPNFENKDFLCQVFFQKF